ncbi:putative disease resistance RPP13-like protein 2 isoform X2 [Panicum miliaceum]|uniref:Disease resistance RPP13-like protein 2 isoform X2 n=1 Tax=Panicum miliaceum TaxID=4540 RepID=A0A3L6PIH5_PANMI|nr:putative disease resistance RPP13-like protein 2 isoform X2 [Panicum miliaceum]
MAGQMMSSSLGAMGSLLGKLHTQLTSPEHQLPESLKDGIEHLKQDLQELNSFLVDLSRLEGPNAMVKRWMSEVRELSYDVEDYVDSTMRPNNTMGSREMNKEILSVLKHFRSLVKQARERHERYELSRWASSNPSSTATDRRYQLHCLNGKKATDLVGIDESRGELVRWLKPLSNAGDAEERLKVKVVSILGPAGVGKSTLAREVYREIGGQFDRRAFVRASRVPDARRLLRSMISQVRRHQRPPWGLRVQELVDNLRTHLQQKRYFIVIDGLWETTSWDIIRNAFPEGAHCSRVLITTDIEEVALECCDYQSNAGSTWAPGSVLEMEPLSIDDSRDLFFNTVFGSKPDFSEELKKYSEDIIRKCSGLPLATTIIASVFACQPDNPELWSHVKECLSPINNLSSEDMLKEIIGLSYYSLSQQLKTCLLYFSLYPEGYTFLKTDLVKQWTAEGFVSAVAGKGANEVAECYFDELVSRGLEHSNHLSLADEVVVYTVHSTIFDVMRRKSVEENFTTVIDYSETIPKLSAKVRRLSLSFSNAKYATKPAGFTLSPVRSLTFYGLVECLPSIMEFKLLRVLILEFWGDREMFDLSGICILLQLRRDDVNRIAGLKELTVLSLYVRQPTGQSIIFNSAAFPVLKYLKFRCGVLRLAFQAEAMPNLRRLKLEFNAHSGEQYGDMLAGIEHLSNLQEIAVRVGAAPGAEESDKMAAESVLKETISKHSRHLSFSVRRTNFFEEEKNIFYRSDELLMNRPTMVDVTAQPNEIDEVQEVSLSSEYRGANDPVKQTDQHQGVSTTARKAKSAGRSASQNKKGDPEALSKDPPSAKASPPRTGSDQVVQKSRNKRRANRPGRLVLQAGVSSLSWEHKGSPERSRATALTRPGRSNVRSSGCGYEMPERESPVPAFGEWDGWEETFVSEGYTDIFNRVREEKQSSDAPARTNGAAYNRSDQGRKYKLKRMSTASQKTVAKVTMY